MFEEKGIIVVEKENNNLDEDEVMLAIDAGAEDFNTEDDIYEIV